MNKSIFLIIILVVVTFGLSLVRIYISNQVDTSGLVLGQVQQQVDDYKLQNMLLAEKLYTETSLTNIAGKVVNLGYVESNGSVVINGQIPVAYKQ